MSSFSDLCKLPKLSVLCMNCGELFNVQFQHIENKTNIQCPSCGESLNKEIFADLKQSIKFLESALLRLKESNRYEGLIKDEEKGFQLSIDWSNKMPNHEFSGFLKKTSKQ